jgi:hypothetical protein
MDPVLLLVQALGGVVGGGVAASLFKALSHGMVGNVLCGIVGGLLGGNLVSGALGVGKILGASGLDPGVLVSQFAGAGVGGGLLMLLVGMLRQMFAK